MIPGELATKKYNTINLACEFQASKMCMDSILERLLGDFLAFLFEDRLPTDV